MNGEPLNVSDECVIFYIFRLRTMTENSWKILKLDWKTPGSFSKRGGNPILHSFFVFDALFVLDF